MAEHACTPPEAVSLDQDDWCCPTCSQWWGTDEDYCYECGRGGPIEWRRAGAHLQGPDRVDGSHYLQVPPPFELWDLMDLTVPRGGVFFGKPEPLPPSPTWVERDAAIRAKYAKRLAQIGAVPPGMVAPGMVASGGWCAPSETIYGSGPL